MTGREIKDRLRRGEPVFGSWVQECNWPGLIQIYSAAGLDFAVIDLEHSSIGSETAAEMIRLGRHIGLAVLVRAPDTLYHLLAKPMDWGAAGLVIPQINTAEQAREVVQCVKYPPVGRRGMSTVTGHRDYVPTEPLADYQVRANEENLVVIQIETKAGLNNADSILATPGLDAVMVGPVDLSVSLGVTGQLAHPSMIEAIEQIIAAGKRNNVAVGIAVGTLEDAKRWCDKGIKFIHWANEIRALTVAITGAVKEFKSFASELVKV